MTPDLWSFEEKTFVDSYLHCYIMLPYAVNQTTISN